MKVVRWISMKDADATGMVESLGGLGGGFNAVSGTPKESWSDYLDMLPAQSRPYAEALRDEVLRLRIRRGGFWHQYDPGGTPVFDDGTCATFSMRAWGDFLAAVWSEHESTVYCYVDFAWHGPEE
jgi:hypothetical protein